MKLMLSYLSIICVILVIGCDNTAKQKAAENEKGDTPAQLVNDNSTKRRYISIGITPRVTQLFRERKNGEE